PKKDHSYFITVDTSSGKGLDYSAFVVFDITKYPYKVAATFNHDEIDPTLYPTEINEVAKLYNEAMVLIEYNFGQEVANILHSELEYENLLWGTTQNRVGQIIGHDGQVPGILMSKAIKRLGCASVKTLLENNQL